MLSPDILNHKPDWNLVTVVPLTSKGTANALRTPTLAGGRAGFAQIAQIRTIDKSRLGTRVDTLDPQTLDTILVQMRRFFS
ncbi:PemK-like protein [Bordetella ansorpii]|uniref:PemK-like protein n=1 Tax=Bordetella ansorpii TaxID=288768 RepID=A0A157R0K1_9BORD|nr:PemK-like protein [Bordetella ansorpii]